MSGQVLHVLVFPQRLDAWCVANGYGEAVVGGFFLRDPYRPLGEVWVEGRPSSTSPRIDNSISCFAGVFQVLYRNRTREPVVTRGGSR